MQQPLVTVVIPTYNSGGLVIESIGSALASTWSDMEVIVVNDGSTDSTSRDVKSLTDPRVKLIDQANGGIGAARNRGIDAARGDFIAFLDHDDLWQPDYLETQIHYLIEHPDIDCAISQWTYTNDLAFRGLSADIKVGPQPDFLALLATGSVMLMSACVVLRRSSLAGLRYPTTRGVMEDVPFYLRLFQRATVAVTTAQPLMRYRRHNHNTSGDAKYFMSGAYEMLRLRRMGELRKRSAIEYAGFVCRVACRKLSQQGDAYSACKTYLDVLPVQVGLGKARFIFGFPLEMLGHVMARRRK